MQKIHTHTHTRTHARTHTHTHTHARTHTHTHKHTVQTDGSEGQCLSGGCDVRHLSPVTYTHTYSDSHLAYE